jgi:hypothetical protein
MKIEMRCSYLQAAAIHHETAAHLAYLLIRNKMKLIDAFLVDAGTGNLHSVNNALRSLGYNIQITVDPADLQHGGGSSCQGWAHSQPL